MYRSMSNERCEHESKMHEKVLQSDANHLSAGGRCRCAVLADLHEASLLTGRGGWSSPLEVNWLHLASGTRSLEA